MTSKFDKVNLTPVHGLYFPANEAAKEARIERDFVPEKMSGIPGDGYVMFTLGPVYYYLNVSFSLIDQFFQSDLGKILSRDYFLVRIEQAFTLLPGWENIVECISSKIWKAFLQFINEVGFCKTLDKKSSVYTIYQADFSVFIDQRPSIVTVFCPRGDGREIFPFVGANGKVEFGSRQTNTTVVDKKAQDLFF